MDPYRVDNNQHSPSQIEAALWVHLLFRFRSTDIEPGRTSLHQLPWVKLQLKSRKTCHGCQTWPQGSLPSESSLLIFSHLGGSFCPVTQRMLYASSRRYARKNVYTGLPKRRMSPWTTSMGTSTQGIKALCCKSVGTLKNTRRHLEIFGNTRECSSLIGAYIRRETLSRTQTI